MTSYSCLHAVYGGNEGACRVTHGPGRQARRVSSRSGSAASPVYVYVPVHCHDVTKLVIGFGYRNPACNWSLTAIVNAIVSKAEPWAHLYIYPFLYIYICELEHTTTMREVERVEAASYIHTINMLQKNISQEAGLQSATLARSLSI